MFKPWYKNMYDNWVTPRQTPAGQIMSVDHIVEDAFNGEAKKVHQVLENPNSLLGQTANVENPKSAKQCKREKNTVSSAVRRFGWEVRDVDRRWTKWSATPKEIEELTKLLLRSALNTRCVLARIKTEVDTDVELDTKLKELGLTWWWWGKGAKDTAKGMQNSGGINVGKPGRFAKEAASVQLLKDCRIFRPRFSNCTPNGAISHVADLALEQSMDLFRAERENTYGGDHIDFTAGRPLPLQHEVQAGGRFEDVCDAFRDEVKAIQKIEKARKTTQSAS